jgi:hypothetical protein
MNVEESDETYRFVGCQTSVLQPGGLHSMEGIRRGYVAAVVIATWKN